MQKEVQSVPDTSKTIPPQKWNNENYFDDIFDEFLDKITQVNFTQSFIKSASRITLEKLNRENGVAMEQGMESSIAASTNLICKDIIKNQKMVIGFKDIPIKERERTLALQHNRQYQWLLVEAYEAFEDYFARLYVHMGLLDNDFWKRDEFGKETVDRAMKQDVDWLVSAVKKKPLNSLKQANKKIPSLAQILSIRKKHDPQNIDYEFMVVLVSKLRHHIVHSHGKTNQVKFTEKLLFTFPFQNRGAHEKQDYAEIIGCYFGTGQLDNLITLLEYENTDRLGDLLSIITSYAMLLHNLMRSYLAEKQHARVQ